MFGIKPFCTSLMALALVCPAAGHAAQRHFVFGTEAKPSPDVTAVNTAAPYGFGTGFGFEGEAPALEANSAGGHPFFFSFDAPEGNYTVTVTLGSDEAATTTVKAELRRLMVETADTPAGGEVTKTFIVNVRTPNLPGGGQVRLKVPRESETEARAWDNRITLEFDGLNPSVREITIAPADVPTIYLLGDSTVCDQSGEPYAAWGQMLPRFFKPTVAIANHAESGETVSGSNGRYRFQKILSLIRPGDVFIVQFGHNDMKELKTDPQAPAKYKAGLINWIKQVQARGAKAVIVTSMNRHSFENGAVTDSLAPYPQLAREAAAETGAPLIDLNAKSKILYEALGAQGSLALFEHSADGSQRDATHQSPYGAYELAKIITQGLRDAHLPLADQLIDGLPDFDPAHPDPESSYKVPPSATPAAAKPFGNEGNTRMIDRRFFLSLSAAAGTAAFLPLAAKAETADLSIQDLWLGDPPGGERVTTPEEVILRHPGGDPNDTAFLHVRKPWLLLRRPAKPNGAAVLLIPGGGYVRVAVSKAGGDIDAWLASLGYTVFTMDYRLPGDPWAAGPEVALQDAQRAIRLIRSRSQELGLDPNRVGVMGFSAGGHVTGLLATRFDKPAYTPVDAADTLSAKPTVAAICYPVVTMMQPYAHQQSMHAALGANPTDEARQANSLELHVPANAPPTFVCATTNDPVVPHQNAMLMFDALNTAKIPTELHLYEGATHGFPLKDKQGNLLPWGPQALQFMQKHGLDAVGAPQS